MRFVKRRKPVRELDPAEYEHVFAVVPEVCDGVDGRRDSCNCLQLRRELRPQGRAAGVLSRMFGFRRPIRVNLDERGTRVWELIDGRRTLREIETRVRAEWGLNEADSKRATVLFIRMLMTRHLVQLRVDGAVSGEDNADT
jgi:hypothetical protein